MRAMTWLVEVRDRDRTLLYAGWYETQEGAEQAWLLATEVPDAEEGETYSLLHLVKQTTYGYKLKEAVPGDEGR